MDARRRAKILVSTACAAGAVLVMAGCSGSDPIVTETPVPNTSESAELQPSATPSVSVSVSPSAAALSDAELLEILPAGAEFPDVEGAVVTAQFFIQEFSRMLERNETEVWQSLSLSGCEFCADGVATAEKYDAKGWVIRGGEIADGPGLTEGNLQEDGTATIKYPATEGAIVVTEPGKAERQATAGGFAEYYLLMELRGTVWRVAEVNVVLS